MVDHRLVKDEFRWSFQKKGKQVLNICTRMVLLCGVSSGLSGVALANPLDGVVTGGAATITSTAAELQINQSSSRAIIDWKSFDIATGETTHFYQPSSSAVALNRVVNSTQLSAINGNLLANGHVFIINPNGILIGGGAHVDTAGFIASSAGIADAAFMGSSGVYEFNIPGNPNAVVENRGYVTVQNEGLAAFVAPVVRNSGVIEGNLAKIQLGAGDTFGVDLYGDGLIHLAVAEPKGSSARNISAENSGSIVTDGGKVLMTAAAASDMVNSAINNSGIIQARGLVSRNGEIILTGGGAAVKVSGTVDVSGVNGGTIKIGGDAQGAGALEKADTVKIADDAVISANAADNGNGGSIVVWSEKNTTSRGSFYARGGASGGNGGLVETSSKGVLDVAGTTVDATAPFGALGLWLLDPTTLTVDAALAETISASGADVSLVTSDALTFAADISVRKAGGINLSATAGGGGINIDNNYIRTNGGGLTFNTTGAVSINNSTLYTRGGFISLTGDTVSMNASAIGTGGGNVDISATSTFGGDAVSINKSSIDASGGLTAGGIDLLKLDGTPHVTGTDADKANFFGNSQNHFDSSQFGGKITVKGKKVGGNSDCFNAGGTLACGAVDDPLPAISLTVVADAQNKVYGSDDPLLTYTYNGALEGTDAFTGVLARDAGTDVGDYAITLGTLTVNGDYYVYTITYTGSTLSITPYELTVAANALSKVYGDTDPALTYGLGKTALQYDDKLSGALARDAGNNVGDYAITQGTLDAGGNYSISYTGSTLSITPYELTLTTNAAGKIYGDPDPELTFSHGGLRNGDSDKVFSGALDRLDGENVGAYEIGLGTLTAGGNYLLNLNRDGAGGFTITPYELTLTTNAAGKIYGDPDPELTFSHGGLRNGDSDGVFNGSLSRLEGENIGTYEIGLGTLTAGGNYILNLIYGAEGGFVIFPVPGSGITNLGPSFGIDVLGRPIISLANQKIVLDSPFERIETLTMNGNISIRFLPPGLNLGDLPNIEPAAGGEPGDDASCANAFLDGKPCAGQ
ncbi:MAG: filamentous hemagglutinin N-terminal domain-containing protein [Alphaproteobacteria bacterium]|nr:filamentous hemagglutinin N-terminal domain-containing protein [Alphaproteobacteria bacterium]